MTKKKWTNKFQIIFFNEILEQQKISNFKKESGKVSRASKFNFKKLRTNSLPEISNFSFFYPNLMGIFIISYV